MTIKKLVRPDGTVLAELDMAKIAAELQTYSMNCLQLSGMTPQLAAEHPGEWVALVDGDLTFAPTDWELWAKLGSRSPYAAYTYLRKPDEKIRTLILARAA